MRLVSPLSQVSDRPVEGRVRGWIVPMRARSAAELHRAATPLELFFDLVLVVAVVFAADALHEAVGEGHGGDALLSYVMVFFAIWWAWMSFSWFASAYDTDDVPYRLAVFLQMTGALILAAGVPRAFEEGDFAVAALGSVVMRLAIVAQWLRAARSDPVRRPTAIRIVVGISVLQVGWVLLVLGPDSMLWFGFVVLMAAELALPIWADHQPPGMPVTLPSVTGCSPSSCWVSRSWPPR